MSLGQGNISVNQGPRPAGGVPPFAAGAADNGLSVDAVTGRIVLGQQVGEVGNPGQLLSNREIPLNGFSLIVTNGGAAIRKLLIDPAADQYAFGDIDAAGNGMRLFFDNSTARYFIDGLGQNFFNIDGLNQTSVWSMFSTAISMDFANKQIALQTDSVAGGIRAELDENVTDPLLNVSRSIGAGHLGVTNQAASTTYNNLFAGGAGWTAQIVHAGNNFGLIVVRATNDGGGANMAFYKTRSVQAGTKVAAVAGDGVGNITWQSVSTNLTVSDCVSQRVEAAGVNVASVDGRWIMQTRAAGSAITERLRIDDAGSFHIGAAATNDASALCQIDSTAKGFLMPRMTTAQKNAIAAPASGLMVYDTTLGKLAVFTGAVWETVTSV